MTPNEINIAIAEACKFQGCCGYEFDTCPAHGRDYLNDLNAMNEAERCLNDTFPNHQSHDYINHLKNVVGGVPGCFAQHCASAAQRAEAFLKTLGLWKV